MKPKLSPAVAGALLALWPALAAAQDAGQVRAQGQPVPQEPAQFAPQAPLGGPGGDPREDMRLLVQEIRAFTQRHQRRFAIVAKGGLGLAVKADPVNEERTVPARGYLRAIDAVMVEAPFYGFPEVNNPTPPDRQERLFRLTEVAHTNRVPVLSIDYADDRAATQSAYAQALRKGFVPFVARAQGMAINRLPDAAQPVQANPRHVLSVSDARNFAVIRDSSGFGSQESFALDLHGTNYDAIMVEVFHRAGDPLGKRAVETLKYKKLGARRLVLAYLNVGTAESFRYYWQPGWTVGSPPWIVAPYPGDPEKYFVEFWNPAWKSLLFGNTDSYLYGIIAQGFDGVVLDGLDTHLYFEGGADTYAQNR